MSFEVDAGEQGNAGLGVDGKVVQDCLAAMLRQICLAWLKDGAFVFCLFQGRLKTGKPLDDCRPFNQAAVGVGKPAEAVLDTGKRCARLHHVAEGHGFGEVHGQGGEDGDEDADAHIGRPEGFLAEFAVGQSPPVVADAEVTLFQTACFRFAAVVEGDLFGMVAHAQEGGTVVGFAVLAVDIEVFQFAANKVGDDGAED